MLLMRRTQRPPFAQVTFYGKYTGLFIAETEYDYKRYGRPSEGIDRHVAFLWVLLTSVMVSNPPRSSGSTVVSDYSWVAKAQ